MMLDDEQCHRAMRARDPRFDGRFFIAVRTTGIYCRPSCPTPVQPKRINVTFHPSAASAQQDGFRACKRCRPDTLGTAPWNSRDDLVGRAVRMIDEGAVDRVGVAGLAEGLHVSERQLTRVLTEHLGAGPLAVARAQRASTARTLIETTPMSFGDVAFAAGFSSIRQFNETIQQLYALSPTQLRRGAPAWSGDQVLAQDRAATVTLRLSTREPFDADALFGFLATRAVTGVEQSVDFPKTYARSILLPGGPATFTIRPEAQKAHSAPALLLTVTLSSMRDLALIGARVRRLFDLDADLLVVADVLCTDETLAVSARKHSGRRAPGAVDPNELAIRAVLGQQVSVAAARTLASRLAARCGVDLPSSIQGDHEGLSRLFPTMGALAALDPTDVGIPLARARALIGLAAALADGRVDLSIGADRDEARAALIALPGIGRWTAGYVTMRALSDPDVLLDDDLAVLNGAKALGIASTSKQLAMWGNQFRPYRSYVTQLLWAACPPPAAKPKKSSVRV
jgi:AraC family transcriptional regulator, regulatory protein of adaptative response / DNA-3-methyladenine glycosylase II